MSWLCKSKNRKISIELSYLSERDSNCTLHDGKMVGTLIGFRKEGKIFEFSIDGQIPARGKKKQLKYTEDWSFVQPRLLLQAGEERASLQTDGRKRKSYKEALAETPTTPTGPLPTVPLNLTTLSPATRAVAHQVPSAPARAAPDTVHTTPDLEK